MDRNIQKLGLINLLALLVVSVAGFAVARYAHSLAGQVAGAFFLIGALAAAVSCFQVRLEARERLEKLEFDELARTAKESTLFTTTEAEVFPARRAREQFERWFLPLFTVFLFVLQAGGAYGLWRWLQSSSGIELTQPLVAMALFGLLALVLFLLGRYSAGMSRLEGQRLLRPGASYLLLSAYLCFLVTADVAAIQAGFPKVDLYVARALAVVLGLVAVENCVSLVLEIYRPRVKGQQARLLYESRLVGLLGHPEGLITTAAQALDYQFGFKVSDTWFYRFLEKALGWLLLAQLGILFVSTCFVFVEPGEQGVLERLGRPVTGREVLEPGPHLKWPWPVDKVYRYRTRQIQSFNVGFVDDGDHEKEKTVLWTTSHYKEEFHLLVASREQIVPADNVAAEQAVPVNLLAVSVPVQYQITNVLDWVYHHADAGQLLRLLATREVVRYLVSVDLNEIMSAGRRQAALDLQARIQQRATELKLGVQIALVGLQDIHPPVKVASAYEAVVGALQEKEAKILKAEGERFKTNALSGAEAFKIVREAEAYQARKEAGAIAQAAQFTNQMVAWQAAPDVYAVRSYLQTLARASRDARKIVFAATNTQEIIFLNLEEKVRPDLLDVTIPSAKSR